MATEPSDAMFSLAGSDPRQELISRGDVDPADLEQIDRLMRAMGALRATERKIAAASQRHMHLKETDMRALHFLITCANTDTHCTPSMLARHLGISTAATTKLLDRLESAEHLSRAAHPTDRRAVTLHVNPETARDARASVGRHHAARFAPAARLSTQERETVIRFLEETAHAMNASLEAASGATWDLPPRNTT